MPFIVLLATLALAIFFDISSREVNSYIFIPSIVTGAIFSFFIGVPYVVAITWVALFFCAFIPAKNILYPVAGILIMVLAITLFFFYPLYLFDSIIIGILFFLGVREKYFGIADVKALIASAVCFPFASGSGYPIFRLLSNIEIPVPFLLIFNASVAGLLFVPYLVLLNLKKKNQFGMYWAYSLAYDQKEFNDAPFKYRISSYNGNRIMVYNSPFMIAIFASIIVAILFGI